MIWKNEKRSKIRH